MAEELTKGWSFTLDDGEKITKVMINHGYIVDGIGFEITDKSGKITVLWFTGPGGSLSEIPLLGNEFITSISGEFGQYSGGKTVIATIMIYTNLKREGYGPYGQAKEVEGLTPFSTSLPIDGSIVGFLGSCEEYLSSIGIYAGRKMIQPYGPYGNTEGSLNWFTELDEGQRFSKITINHGYIVDGIGFEITDQSGQTVTHMFSGPGGSPSEIDLGDNEYITQISGTYGKYFGQEVRIATMTIYTNEHPAGHGPYGTGQEATDVKPFSTPVPLEGSIAGFLGSYGQYLNSIGIINKYKKVETYGPYGRH